MTARRWIADEFGPHTAALVGNNARHLAVVLRARVGQEFTIACGGTLRLGAVTSVSPARVEFALREELPSATMPPITVLLSIFKFDRMEWAIEKCTELGATRIVLAIAQRTDKHLVAAAAKRVERWRRIAREAAQQARLLESPEIAAPGDLRIAIDDFRSDLNIVLAETERDAPLSQVIQPGAGQAGITLAFGPEGGWTPDELTRFQERGWHKASLGSGILRAETAAIAALAVAVSLSANH
jgi:16S rRNA (uracil1498-N3)-methyltransferase